MLHRTGGLIGWRGVSSAHEGPHIWTPGRRRSRAVLGVHRLPRFGAPGGALVTVIFEGLMYAAAGFIGGVLGFAIGRFASR